MARPLAESNSYPQRKHDKNRLWYQDFSSWQLRAVAFGIGAAVFASAFIAERFAVRQGWSAAWLMVVNSGVAAVVAGLFALKLMRYSQQRRRAIVQRLQIIAEMNHHIRNSLDVIAMSAYATRNEEAIEKISAAAERIQWTLREVLTLEDGDRSDQSTELGQK